MSPLAALLALALAPAPGSTGEPSVVASAETKPPIDLDRKRLLVFVAGRGATRLVDTDPSFGGSANVGLGVRLVRGLFVQLEIGEAFFSAPGQNVGTVIGGLRYELRRWERLRPSAFLGFTHAHQAGFASLRAAPIATLAGAADSIEHRTGIQADLALRVPFPEHWPRPLTRFSGLFRADLGYYVDRVPAPLHVGVGAGVSVTF